MRQTFLTFFVLLFMIGFQGSAGATEENRPEPKTASNETRLDLEFDSLRESGRSERIRGGVAQLITGTALGIWALTANDYSSSDRTLLGVTSGVGIGLGIFQLLSHHRYEKAADLYTARQATDKQTYGEESLHALAEKDRNKRILTGIISTTLGTGFILWGALSHDESSVLGDDFNGLIYRPYLYVAGGAMLVAGVVSFFVKTPAENSEEKYFGRKLKTSFHWGFGVSPDGKGPALSAQIRF